MRQIHKFVIPVAEKFEFSMPTGATLLGIHEQGDRACLWALVDPNAPPRKRHFRVYGTGHDILNVHSLVFIGTFLLQEGTFVGHVFEELAPS